MSATIPLPVPRAARPEASTPQPATPWATWRSRVRDAFADWSQWRAMRATRHALLRLDERTLHDMGFRRAEIESVAAEAHGGVAVTRTQLLAQARSLAH